METNNNSFFNDESKSKVICNTSNEQSLTKTETKQLDTEIGEIDKQIINLESVKSHLLQQRFVLENKLLIQNEHLKNDKVITPLFKSEVIDFENAQLITITMPFRLPVYKKNIGKKYEYYKELNATYTVPMTQSLTEIQKQKQLEKIDKVFVLITHYTSSELILDTDNRFHSFIFNSIRASKLIEDDSHSKLSYMENGYSITGFDAVRVVISNYNNLSKAIKYNEVIRVNT